MSGLVSAAVLLPSSPPLENALPSPQPISSQLLSRNIANTSSPPSNVLHFQCNGEYGRDLNPSSCRDVFNYIGKSDTQTPFSERRTGRPNDVPLPLRFMSNDGLCFVQPLLLRGAVTAHTSVTQMAQAAYTLFQRCVVDKGIGGIAANIGESVFSLILHIVPRPGLETRGSLSGILKTFPH